MMLCLKNNNKNTYTHKGILILQKKRIKKMVLAGFEPGTFRSDLLCQFFLASLFYFLLNMKVIILNSSIF